MPDKCTGCSGTGLKLDKLENVVVYVNCPDCHGLGRVGE